MDLFYNIRTIQLVVSGNPARRGLSGEKKTYHAHLSTFPAEKACAIIYNNGDFTISLNCQVLFV